MLVPHQFYMDMEGVSPFMMQPEGLASGIRNSTKVEYSGYSYDCEVFAIKMAKAVGIDLRGTMTVSPPLTLYADCCEAGFRYAEAGFPLAISSGAVFGGTGPATIAGTTVSNNAEIISGLVLVQLFRPGTGIVACDFTFPMDMQFGHPVFGALGSALHQVIFDQICIFQQPANGIFLKNQSGDTEALQLQRGCQSAWTGPDYDHLIHVHLGRAMKPNTSSTNTGVAKP